jgi:hypothetical protein
MDNLQALTLRQPWAHYVVRGPKRIENRSWAPPRSLVGGDLAIHAGKHCDVDEIAAIIDEVKARTVAGRVAPGSIQGTKVRDLPFGAVVGVARVTGYVTASNDPWFEGPFGWTLDDVVAIEPVPCKGAQGLFALPPDVLATVRERYRVARAEAARGAQ